jgi:hypothetical protein
MSEQTSLEQYFGDVPDPRVIGRCAHKSVDIILIGICGVLCGAEGWEDIEEFGQNKAAWLKQFLELKHGIPSHDTFRRVFSLLDAEVFQARFMRWVEGCGGQLTYPPLILRWLGELDIRLESEPYRREAVITEASL